MSKLQTWIEQEFAPWQANIQQIKDERTEAVNALYRNASKLQIVVANLLDGKTASAVKGWNAMGIEPQLKKVKVNSREDTITLIPVRGEAIIMGVEEMLMDMGELVKG